jgi:hypothetical protein
MLPDPKSTIAATIRAFDEDEETKLTESTLTTFLEAFPENRKVEHVQLKVIAINTLYRARMLNKDYQCMSEHIASLKIDDSLREGDPTVVALIWDCKKATKRWYSFATKYCSWHNQEAYSLYDGNVEAALLAYMERGDGLTFHKDDIYGYPRLVGIVKEFRKVYDLDDYSLKKIDKFLWKIGKDILADKKSARSQAR